MNDIFWALVYDSCREQHTPKIYDVSNVGGGARVMLALLSFHLLLLFGARKLCTRAFKRQRGGEIIYPFRAL